MTQLSSQPPASPARQALPGLPRTGLTPQQQLEALARVQDQAEQRVRLGLQLFKAAEAHTASHQQILDDITAERVKFRDETSKEIARRLHAFDEWIGQMDDTFTKAFVKLEQRVDSVEQKLTDQQRHLEAMISQTQKMLDQATALLNGQGIAPTVDLDHAAKQNAGPKAVRPLQTSPSDSAVRVNETTDEKTTVVTSNLKSFIKPVPPVKLADLSQPTASSASGVSSNKKASASDDTASEGPVCQTVSYADILDRIYASRQQIKQDK